VYIASIVRSRSERRSRSGGTADATNAGLISQRVIVGALGCRRGAPATASFQLNASPVVAGGRETRSIVEIQRVVPTTGGMDGAAPTSVATSGPMIVTLYPSYSNACATGDRVSGRLCSWPMDDARYGAAWRTTTGAQHARSHCIGREGRGSGVASNGPADRQCADHSQVTIQRSIMRSREIRRRRAGWRRRR